MTKSNRKRGESNLPVHSQNAQRVRSAGDVSIDSEHLARLIEENRQLRKVQCERDVLLEQVHDLRAANEQLVRTTFDAEHLRHEAESASQRQHEFLAMLAHELRNPLAPIRMAASILAKSPALSPELARVQEIIQRQAGHLTRLLDDLLDAARINSGKITLARSLIPVSDQLLDAAEMVQSRIDERRQHLDIEFPPKEAVINGDAVRLTQVFSNLLVNASKFTPDGGRIVVRSSIEGTNVRISVADNGAGMDPHIIPDIFSLFTQGPRSLARSEGGLGIGLNVVRNVVHMHGGAIEASSQGLGLGSTFTLTLPLANAGQVPAHRTPASAHVQPALGHRILVVEDNPDANEMLRILLEAEGHSVVSVFDGPTGLSTARSEYFDVIVCDIGLPGLDGYSLIRSLRDLADTASTFAVAVSGYGQFDDEARSIAAGFNRHLVKPIDTDVLLDLIDSVPARRT